jgi:hypothetical protein
LIGEVLAVPSIEAVEALSTLALLHQKAGIRQDSKVMRDRRLGEFETFRELRDVQPLSRKDGDDLLAGRVGERCEAAPHSLEVDSFEGV